MVRFNHGFGKVLDGGKLVLKDMFFTFCFVVVASGIVVNFGLLVMSDLFVAVGIVSVVSALNIIRVKGNDYE